MSSIGIRRHEVSLLPESARVIIRPFIPGEPWRIEGIIERTLELTDKNVTMELNLIRREFESRHFDVETVLLRHFEKIVEHLPSGIVLSRERKLLIGALFSGEYALESAALFNPSIVPYPDQEGVPAGGLRFIMSLRATGEGHISSIEFRSGNISPNGAISVDLLAALLAGE